MQRRELFRLLGAGAVLPAMTPEIFTLLRQAQPGADYKLRTLDAHQNATVVAMIDLIIPETDTPGAKGARVNEFIDLILTDWAIPEERKAFLDGLAEIDKQSNDLFGKKFADASPQQQEAQLRAIDDVLMGDRQRPVRHGNTVPEPDTQMKGPFWIVFKNITLHGYYTSQVAFEKELKLQIIPGAQHGCAPVGQA
ncbi:MAG: gluconate 2-dehydrogenase subunit 3 family protein [Acidobacteria bacterium]|nr:gluconate 2-dehydrogenase subunit 3 family protein [Acidobacteriota bacterium]MBS1866000.1 gluconate 2-dehydrogenase subunit 3 family protein [Acidobacteriota bacterium]